MVRPSQPSSRRWPEWEQVNPGLGYDPDLFRREILPGLAAVKLAEIMEAAGVSKGVGLDHPVREVHAARVDVGGARSPLGDVASVAYLVASSVYIRETGPRPGVDCRSPARKREGACAGRIESAKSPGW